MKQKIILLIIDRFVIALIVTVVGIYFSGKISASIKQNEKYSELNLKKTVLVYQPILYRIKVDSIMWKRVNEIKKTNGDTGRIGVELRMYLDRNLEALVKEYENALREIQLSSDEINAIALLSAHVATQSSCIKINGANGKLYPEKLGFMYPTTEINLLLEKINKKLVKMKF